MPSEQSHKSDIYNLTTHQSYKFIHNWLYNKHNIIERDTLYIIILKYNENRIESYRQAVIQSLTDIEQHQHDSIINNTIKNVIKKEYKHIKANLTICTKVVKSLIDDTKFKDFTHVLTDDKLKSYGVVGGLNEYQSVINDQPIDLYTIYKSLLNTGNIQYNNAYELCIDLFKVVVNAIKFNKNPSNPVHKSALELCDRLCWHSITIIRKKCDINLTEPLCYICGSGESLDYNKIVECSTCHLWYHQVCGYCDDPAQEWSCNTCIKYAPNTPRNTLTQPHERSNLDTYNILDQQNQHALSVELVHDNNSSDSIDSEKQQQQQQQQQDTTMSTDSDNVQNDNKASDETSLTNRCTQQSITNGSDTTQSTNQQPINHASNTSTTIASTETKSQHSWKTVDTSVSSTKQSQPQSLNAPSPQPSSIISPKSTASQPPILPRVSHIQHSAKHNQIRSSTPDNMSSSTKQNDKQPNLNRRASSDKTSTVVTQPSQQQQQQSQLLLTNDQLNTGASHITTSNQSEPTNNHTLTQESTTVNVPMITEIHKLHNNNNNNNNDATQPTTTNHVNDSDTTVVSNDVHQSSILSPTADTQANISLTQHQHQQQQQQTHQHKPQQEQEQEQEQEEREEHKQDQGHVQSRQRDRNRSSSPTPKRLKLDFERTKQLLHTNNNHQQQVVFQDSKLATMHKDMRVIHSYVQAVMNQLQHYEQQRIIDDAKKLQAEADKYKDDVNQYAQQHTSDNTAVTALRHQSELQQNTIKSLTDTIEFQNQQLDKAERIRLQALQYYNRVREQDTIIHTIQQSLVTERNNYKQLYNSYNTIHKQHTQCKATIMNRDSSIKLLEQQVGHLYQQCNQSALQLKQYEDENKYLKHLLHSKNIHTHHNNVRHNVANSHNPSPTAVNTAINNNYQQRPTQQQPSPLPSTTTNTVSAQNTTISTVTPVSNATVTQTSGTNAVNNNNTIIDDNEPPPLESP